MSTGLDCYFEQREDGKWMLYLEQTWGCKMDIEYDEFGPFDTLAIAEVYLRDNFANPGGYAVCSHPGHPEESFA